MEDSISVIGRVVLGIISLISISAIIKLKYSKRVGNEFFTIMIIFWFSVLIISIKPEILEPVLNDIGFVNRAQFLLALSMGIILYLLYQQSMKSKIFLSRYNQLIRETALEQFSLELEKIQKQKTDIVIIIVAKNEDKSIGKIINDIHSLSITESFQIIVINDGSTDKTAKVAHQNGALVVNHFFNLGIGGAIKTGFLASKLLNPDIVINLDADGQHDPKYIPEMISLIKNANADLIYASRFHSKSQYSTSSVRSFGNKFYTKLINKLGNLSISDVTSGYRAIRASKIKSIFFVSETNFAIELALRAGKNHLNIMEIPITASEREYGASQFYKIENFLVYNTRAILQIFRAKFRNTQF